MKTHHQHDGTTYRQHATCGQVIGDTPHTNDWDATTCKGCLVQHPDHTIAADWLNDLEAARAEKAAEAAA